MTEQSLNTIVQSNRDLDLTQLLKIASEMSIPHKHHEIQK